MTVDLLTLDPDEALLLAPAEGRQLSIPIYEEVLPDSPDFVVAGAEYLTELAEEEARRAVLRGGYEGARTCTGGPEPGTKNLMSFFLGRYASKGGINLGIYNCRSVRGATTTSVHGEGRAGDHGCPVGAPWMQEWADLLVAHSYELGIQCVIFNRRIWSSSYPDAWRAYTGAVPHLDHSHVEQTRHSARTLTLARINEVLGTIPAPRPAPPVVNRPLIQQGSKGQAVSDWQSYLRRNFPAYRHDSPVKRGVLLKVDGDFGSWTAAWTRMFQERSGIGVDGKVGPQTWRKAGF